MKSFRKKQKLSYVYCWGVCLLSNDRFAVWTVNDGARDMQCRLLSECYSVALAIIITPTVQDILRVKESR